jgi:hypothetical protein
LKIENENWKLKIEREMAKIKETTVSEDVEAGVSMPVGQDEKKTGANTPAPVSKNAETAEEIFKYYPKREVLYFTTDGHGFFEQCDAINHAQSLNDKEIETIKKQQ